MMRSPPPSCLPVRKKKGTPAQRQLSMSQRSATNVSVSDSGATPGIVAIALVLARATTWVTSSGRMERKTLFFSSLMATGSRAVGGSMAMKARIWKRWVTTMSLKAPVAS